MPASSYQHFPVLFPASLLVRRRRWQNQVRQASGVSWLIVTDLNNPKQTLAMLRLGKKLEGQGKRVDVLSVGK